MKTHFSVADLYPLALAEGEGMGTAYEYVTKIQILGRFLATAGSPRTVLMGGLPEAYGLDLGLALYVARQGCDVTVADDRPSLLDALATALGSPFLSGELDRDRFRLRRLDTLACPAREADHRFDLWLSTSAIQRLKEGGLTTYLAQVRAKSKHAVLFAPNAANRAHTTISGLSGFRLPELAGACAAAGLQVGGSGHVDMPPFPPGLQRSAEAKEHAAQSRVEGMAMRVLGTWARLERLLPGGVRRRYSHLVYVLLSS